MGKKDMFVHGTLSDAINWEQFFDPKNHGESFLDKGCVQDTNTQKPDTTGKRLAKTKANPRPKQK